MSNMTPKKAFIVIALILIRPFIGFFNLSRNSMYVLPINGLYTEIFTYSPFIDSIIQPDPSLVQLSILFKFLEKIYQDHIYHN